MSNRTLAILAAVAWAVAVVLAGFYLSGAGADTTLTAGAGAAAMTAPETATTLLGATVTFAPTTSYTTSSTIPATTSTTSTTTTSITTSTTTTTEPPPPPALTVAAGGDVLGDRGVGIFMDEQGGEAVFAKVKPLLETAQLAFVNLESPISDKGSRKPNKQYTFRSRPALIEGLASAGIDVVSLANNHSLDYGPAALLDTIARLDKAAINHAGAGADAASAQAPALFATPAGIVAILAFTELIPADFPATSKTPGVNPTTPDRKKLLTAIAAADKKADFVIVSFHWGTEYTGRANEDQRRLAHQAVEAGADLVLGHHPHVIQGLELYRDKLIAYSLGDFVWDHYSRETGETFVLRVAIEREGPPTVEVVPVYLTEETGVPVPVTGDEADVILTRLARLSADLGLELSRSSDRAFYVPVTASAPTAAASP